MKRSIILAAMLGSTPAVAFAQAAAPVGLWATADGGEQFIIEASGQCAFQSTTGTYIAGACSWNADSAGGILTIMEPMALGPAPIRFSVVWINQTTINVFGDTYYRRG